MQRSVRDLLGRLDTIGHIAAVGHDRPDVDVVEQVRGEGLEVSPRAVRMTDAELHGVGRPGTGDHAVEGLLDAFAVVSMHELEESHTDRARVVVSENRGRRRTDPCDAAVRIEQADHIGRVLHQRFEPPLTSLQRLLGIALGGDVFSEADEVHDRAVVVAYRRDARASPHDGPVGAHESLLDELVVGAGQQEPIPHGQAVVAVVRMADIGEAQLQQALLGAAEDPAQRVVHLQVATVGAEHRHAGGGVGEGVAEPFVREAGLGPGPSGVWHCRRWYSSRSANVTITAAASPSAPITRSHRHLAGRR